jgi:hypothetical protein
LRGGCSVIEDVAGYYLSRRNEVIDDRVSVVYSDFPLAWSNSTERTEALLYCAELEKFLLKNLWEESILITAQPLFHINQ